MAWGRDPIASADLLGSRRVRGPISRTDQGRGVAVLVVDNGARDAPRLDQSESLAHPRDAMSALHSRRQCHSQLVEC